MIRRSSRVCFGGLALTLALSASTAWAGEPQARVRFRPGPEGQPGVQVLQQRDGREEVVAIVPLPRGPVYDTLRIGDTLYVARGPLGVTSIDVSDLRAPKVLSTFGAGPTAVRLSASGSLLLVVVAEYSAVAYDVSDRGNPVATRPEGLFFAAAAPPSSPGPQAPPPQPASSRPAGAEEDDATAPDSSGRERGPAQVVAVRGGWLTIQSAAPLAPGDRFIIRSQRRIKVIDPVTGGSRSVPSNRDRGVFVVEQVREGRGSGRLLRGTVAAVGDIAQPTERRYSQRALYFPPLWSGMTRVQASVTPFLPVQELGFGLLSRLSVEHYFSFPLKLGVEAAPLGLLALSGGTGVVAELRGKAAYASDYFEIGLDVGGQLRHFAPSRVLLAFSLRVGSLDGLNLHFSNAYSIADEGTRQRFVFANAFGEFNIPVHQRVTLNLAGGGSDSWAYGTLGVRGYLRGAGGPGTVILSTALGGVWLSDRQTSCTGACQQISGAGPALSVGIDARF